MRLKIDFGWSKMKNKSYMNILPFVNGSGSKSDSKATYSAVVINKDVSLMMMCSGS